MWLLLLARDFFFGVPRIGEIQDPDSSPRREEVGRRTLGGYGGFLLPFFYLPFPGSFEASGVESAWGEVFLSG